MIGAAAALGGAFALDQAMHSSTRHMGEGVASGFQNGGNLFTYCSSGALYLWGLQSDNKQLRQDQSPGPACAADFDCAISPFFGNSTQTRLLRSNAVADCYHHHRHWR